MSFTVYSYLDKIPFIGAPIPYGFALKTQYKHLFSNSLKTINVYYYGYNKPQAVINENFLRDKYKDSWTIVDLATSIPIFNYINLVFMVLSMKKTRLNIIIIGVEDLNWVIKRKRLSNLYKIV